MCPNDNVSYTEPPHTKPPLPRRYDSLFDSEAGSDIIFHVGPEKWRLPGHKAILTASNPVFQAMLDGPLATKESIITIEDVDGRAFENLLRYLYREEVQLQSISTALNTLHAAFKYLCGGLVQICVQYLDSQVDSSSVLDIYRHVRIYSEPQLQLNQNTRDENSSCPSAPPLEAMACGGSAPPIGDESYQYKPRNSEDIPDAMSYCGFLHHNCLQYIDIHANEVLVQEQVEDLDLEVLRLIAERDTLSLSTESVLFDALDRWCNRECKRRRLELSAENRRAVLGQETLFTVRYLLMSSEEFLVGPMQSGLLDQSETSMLLGHILHHPLPHNPPAHLAKVLSRMQTRRNSCRGEPVPLSWRSTPRISSHDTQMSPGSSSASGRRWGGRKCGKKDSKKNKKTKSKSSSPERENLERRKQSTGSCIAGYVLSALSCVFD